MAPVTFLVHGYGIAQAQPAAADQLPFLRIAVRVLIAALIALLVTYIVIEQVGSWRRRRSGRD